EWLAAMPSSLAVTSTVLMVLEPPKAEPVPGTVVALETASGRLASATVPVPVDGWADVGAVLSSWPKPSFSLIRSNRPMGNLLIRCCVSFDWDSETKACIQHRRSDWQPQRAGRVQWAQSRRY